MSSFPKKLRTIQLVAVIFLTVSGGPYGLEPLLTYAGEHAALILLLITPLLWDIPTIFVVLELNSMMPVTGGYYQWVKRATGMRWAFYEGWWTWLYTFVDLAIYPVLFVTYAVFFFPQISAYKIPVCLVVIWASAALNIRGIVHVGKASVLLGMVVLIPFVVLFATFISHSNFSLPGQSLKGLSFSSAGMALYTIMWNFIGWDNATTYAEEVKKPVRTYLVAVLVAFAVILSVYLLAMFVAINSGLPATTLTGQGFPAIGIATGGQWLGALIAAGGMASALGLYAGVLLSVSRIPQVMAEDKLLPQKLTALHSKFQTPYISIITCSVVVSAMIFWSFESLIIIDVTLYGAALFLEYIALIIIRYKEPFEKRPFRIPLNIVGLCFMTLIPLSVYSIAIAAAAISAGDTVAPLFFALAALLSAEAAWRLIEWRSSRKLKI